MVKVTNLLKKYPNRFELNVPFWEISCGEILGLVGNNGAGKTTFFRAILDLIPLNEGSIRLNGNIVNKDESWKMITGSYLDDSFVIDFLTPEEYFHFVGSLYEMSKNKVSEVLEKYGELFNFEILEKKNKLIREMSSGNIQKIGIVAAMMIEPKVLILDEPFANLDPTSQFYLIELLRELKEKKKTTILISSHNLNHVTEICTRICVLEKGKIVKDVQTSDKTLKDLQQYFSPVGK